MLIVSPDSSLKEWLGSPCEQREASLVTTARVRTSPEPVNGEKPPTVILRVLRPHLSQPLNLPPLLPSLSPVHLMLSSIGRLISRISTQDAVLLIMPTLLYDQCCASY